MTLSNRFPALVTGAADGIGKAIAVRLLRQGRPVIALDRRGDALTKLNDELNNRSLLTCECDLARPHDLPPLIKRLAAAHGPITALVNNAGIWQGGLITEITDDVWNQVQTVNLTAPFVLIRELAAVMAEAGGGGIVGQRYELSVSSRPRRRLA